jgi:hypothetical protein
MGRKRTPPLKVYQKFKTLLLDANEAKSTDVTEAIKLLNDHPELRQYLASVQEREAARISAQNLPNALLGQSADLLWKTGAPTGSSPQDQGSMASWGGNRNQPIGVANSRLLREWADTNEWARSAINIRRAQVGRADILVAPADPDKPFDKSVLREVQFLLDQPNELRDSYRSLIEPVIEDILVLDRGVISKSMTVGDKKIARKPVRIYCEDGATVKIYPAWTGDPKEPRYLYEEPSGTKKIPLLNDEAIVIMDNPASYRYGLSPMTVLQNTIRADLKATQSAMHMVDMKPPPHVLQIPGISQTTLDKLKTIYDQEIGGRKEMFFLGGPQAAHVFPLVFSAKDNQWMEWQQYLARKIAIVFRISPQQLGITFDINKATASSQQEIYEDTGLIPLLLLLEEFLNRELLADFAPVNKLDWRKDLEALNLRIVYPEISEASRRMHSEKLQDMFVKGLAGLPSMTLNDALAMQGKPPVRGGNTFWYAIGQSVLPIASYDGDLGVYADVMIGSQDPAGGGPLIMDPPKPKDETPGKRRVPKPDAADTANDDSSGTGSGLDLRDSEQYDYRPPGKAWSVRHKRGF